MIVPVVATKTAPHTFYLIGTLNISKQPPELVHIGLYETAQLCQHDGQWFITLSHLEARDLPDARAHLRQMLTDGSRYCEWMRALIDPADYEPHLCDVCRKNPMYVVACSSLGACSFAYCRECGASGAEPYGVLVGYLAITGLSSRDAVHEAYRSTAVDATLRVAGKTEEEFWSDVARATTEVETGFEKYDADHKTQEEGEELL